MDAFLPWILEAIPSIPHSSSFRAMDVGSSEGANAIHAMQRIVETFRATSNAPMHLFFDDLPTNDFNRLSANLHPNGGSAFSQSEVYTACIGGSAFGRLVPAESLQVATTFNAIGFLEKRPDVGLPNYIIPNSPSTNSPRNGVSATEAEIAPFRAEAARDLELFYAMDPRPFINPCLQDRWLWRRHNLAIFLLGKSRFQFEVEEPPVGQSPFVAFDDSLETTALFSIHF